MFDNCEPGLRNTRSRHVLYHVYRHFLDLHFFPIRLAEALKTIDAHDIKPFINLVSRSPSENTKLVRLWCRSPHQKQSHRCRTEPRQFAKL